MFNLNNIEEVGAAFAKAALNNVKQSLNRPAVSNPNTYIDGADHSPTQGPYQMEPSTAVDQQPQGPSEDGGFVSESPATSENIVGGNTGGPNYDSNAFPSANMQEGIRGAMNIGAAFGNNLGVGAEKMFGPTVNAVGAGLNATGQAIAGGVGQIMQGGNDLGNAITGIDEQGQQMSAEDRLYSGAQAITDTANGAMNAAFSPAAGIGAAVPPLGAAMGAIGEGVNWASQSGANAFMSLSGINPNSKQGKTLSGLFGTLGNATALELVQKAAQAMSAKGGSTPEEEMQKAYAKTFTADDLKANQLERSKLPIVMSEPSPTPIDTTPQVPLTRATNWDQGKVWQPVEEGAQTYPPEVYDLIKQVKPKMSRVTIDASSPATIMSLVKTADQNLYDQIFRGK